MMYFSDFLETVNRTASGCIRIPRGVYRFREPIRLHESNLSFIGEEGTVFRGTIPLTGADFTEIADGVFSAPVPCPTDGLYIGERRYSMARYPKATDPSLPFGGYAADCMSPEKVKEWQNPAGGYIHALHDAMWGGYSFKIKGKNPDGTLDLEGGWQNNQYPALHENYRFAENIREEMTAPGEWVYDEAEGRIYLRLAEGDNLDEAEITVSDGFFLLEGCENVRFERITFERCRRTFMEAYEPLLRSDWCIHRGGALVFRESRGCVVERCEFREIGTNVLFADGKNLRLSVTKSHLHHIGGSGICFVGRADAVRSPAFLGGKGYSFPELDLTPGPKSDNYPALCLVEDCLIEHIGLTEKQTAGVQISMAYGITVRNCTICHTPRAGINISEGTFGGHRIEGCDVFDTVRETGDHGSFNSWGRDRFWGLSGLEDDKIGDYARLDMLSPNVIARNRFRCDHGWDIDLDDGSSNYIITENLCLNGGLKLREGFFRRAERNITVNDTVHFHVWYKGSGDVVRENIVFVPYKPIGMPSTWGDIIDGNYLHVEKGADAHAEALTALSSKDADSMVLDAGFLAPNEGNYIPTHPRLTAFAEFPTVFGVRFAPLRRLADTPVLPTGMKAEDIASEAGERCICGATVRNILNDDEMSVYGLAEHNGILVCAVAEDSPAKARGLCDNDVIIAIGEKKVKNTDDLSEEAFRCELTVRRKQRQMVLSAE